MKPVFGHWRTVWMCSLLALSQPAWRALAQGTLDEPPAPPDPIAVAQPIEPVDAPRPYAYDRRDWDQRVAEVYNDPEKKTAVLASRWFVVSLAVGHANVVAHRGFPNTLTFWSTSTLRCGDLTKRSDRDLYEPVHYDKSATVMVRSDCLSDIVITKDADCVFIYGDLRGTVDVTGTDVEIVIGGNLHRRGQIITHGSASIFIGGNVEGEIHNHGEALVWVGGNHDGRITTGDGRTDVLIMGNYNGLLYPENLTWGSALYLTVHGYMHSDSMRAITQFPFQTIRGSVGYSELAAAFHPRTHNPKIGKWVVQHQVKVQSDESEDADPSPQAGDDGH